MVREQVLPAFFRLSVLGSILQVVKRLKLQPGSVRPFLHGMPTELAGCMRRSSEAEEAVIRNMYSILSLCKTAIIHFIALSSGCGPPTSPQGHCFLSEQPLHRGGLFSCFLKTLALRQAAVEETSCYDLGRPELLRETVATTGLRHLYGLDLLDR